MYKSLNEFEIQPDATTGFHGNHRVIMGKCCQHSSAFIFYRIFFILAGKENIHYISDEFEIWPDRTKDCGVKRCHHIFSAIFDWILFIFAGNENMYRSLNEFQIQPDATTGFHGNR